MIVVWVRLQVREGREEAFREAIGQNARSSLADESGCLRFDVVRLGEGAGWFAFYEVYRSREAYEDVHRTTPHYAAWRAASAELVVAGTQTIATGTLEELA